MAGGHRKSDTKWTIERTILSQKIYYSFSMHFLRLLRNLREDKVERLLQDCEAIVGILDEDL